MFLVSHLPEFISCKEATVVNDSRGGDNMSDSIVITAIVCVTIVSIVSIFAILAYLKERANLRYKNSFKGLNKEASITVCNDKNENSKK